MSDHEACLARIRTLERHLESAERANRELQQALVQLDQAAGTDRLTGIWNRRRFEEGAAILISLARRGKGPVSLLLFDLDHFKRVNDTCGHAAGDEVLTETVRCVREHLRDSDALVRWGGEEFIVLSPATRLEGALSLAEKIRAAVEAHAYPQAGPMTVSIGVAEFAPGMELESWVRSADEAMYQAKAEGRNRVRAARPEDAAEEEPSLLEIVWEDAHACGEPTIDAQHQRLFALANGLFGALSSHQPPQEIALRIRKLAAHTAQHFRDEELLLQRAEWPGLPEHARSHARLLLRMNELEAQCDRGGLEFGRLVEFLILDLVQGHLQSEDTQFFPCFRRPGPPGRPVLT